jgi:hypothetical protein
MDLTKHINKINGFAEVYDEVYESVRVLTAKNDGFVLMRSHEVAKAFEKKYNVELISTSDNISPVGDMVHNFDSVNFKTRENLIMCLLKWT